MLSSVAVLAYEGVSTFGLGVTAEVFACGSRGEGIPRACLHVIRLEHGAAVANEVARHMVVAPHRDGGQAQFVPVLVDDRADGPDLARQVNLAPRTFARWFAARTGTTPHQWLTSQRLSRAQELLERTDLGVEQVAADCGLTPLMLRRHFTRRWGITSPSLPAPLQPASGLTGGRQRALAAAGVEHPVPGVRPRTANLASITHSPIKARNNQKRFKRGGPAHWPAAEFWAGVPRCQQPTSARC